MTRALNEIETDDEGRLIIPPSVLGGPGAHVKYKVKRRGNEIRLAPSEPVDPKDLPPEERAREFKEWVRNLQPKAPILPDEALHRESFYD
jgi:hypothetical protein